MFLIVSLILISLLYIHLISLMPVSDRRFMFFGHLAHSALSESRQHAVAAAVQMQPLDWQWLVWKPVDRGRLETVAYRRLVTEL